MLFIVSYNVRANQKMASSSSLDDNQRRVVLIVDDKLKVCEMVHRKVLQAEIKKKPSIGRSIVKDICKSEDNLK